MDPHWSTVFKSITSQKIGQARLANKKVVNSHEAASTEELELLSISCIWQGSSKMADFFALNRALYHLVARCCEGSSLKKSMLAVKEIKEGVTTYNCLNFTVDRNKTEKYQDLVVYSHRDSFLQCLYFALAYKLIMDNGEQDELFPRFYSHIKKEESSTKIDSSTSRVFSEYYNDLASLSETFDVSFGDEDEPATLSKGMTSHSLCKFFCH